MRTMSTPFQQERQVGLYVDTQRSSHHRHGSLSSRHNAQSSWDQEKNRRSWDLKDSAPLEDNHKCSLPPIRDLLEISASGPSGRVSGDHSTYTTSGWKEPHQVSRDTTQASSRFEMTPQSALSPRSLPMATGIATSANRTSTQMFPHPYVFPPAQLETTLPNFERHEHRRSFASTNSNSSMHSASTISSYSTSVTSAPNASPSSSCPRIFSTSAPQINFTPQHLALQRSLPFDFPPRIQPQTPQSPLSTASADTSPTTAPSTISDAWSHRASNQMDSHYTHGSTSVPSSNLPQDRYICPTCGKAFSRPSSLRIHSHSHTGEKPFRCPQRGCGKAFSVRSNMKRHERGCHAERRASDAIKNSSCREILPAAG